MLSGWCKFGEILRGPFLSFFPSNMNLESEFEFEAKYINVLRVHNCLGIKKICLHGQYGHGNRRQIGRHASLET